MTGAIEREAFVEVTRAQHEERLAGSDRVVVAGEHLGDLRAERDAELGALGGRTDNAGGAHGDVYFDEWERGERGSHA